MLRIARVCQYDEGLAALVAPPPADAPPPQAEALPRLKVLDLGMSQITDDRCAHLASRLRSGLRLHAQGYRRGPLGRTQLQFSRVPPAQRLDARAVSCS